MVVFLAAIKNYCDSTRKIGEILILENREKLRPRIRIPKFEFLVPGRRKVEMGAKQLLSQTPTVQ